MSAPEPAGPDADFEAVLELIRRSFADMEGRIDPPSSMHRLTAAEIARQAETHEVWLIRAGDAPVACMFLTAHADRLYLGKLAVDAAHRGAGHARALIETAVARARARDLPAIELQTRVELIENHRFFAAMGFSKTGETAHPGYDRPTSVTMRRPVGAPHRVL